MAHLVHQVTDGGNRCLRPRLLLPRHASMSSEYVPIWYTYFPVGSYQSVSEFWNNHPASEKCIPKGPTLGITYALAALNAIADWALGLLPFFIVWGLEMKKKTKFLVAGILAFAAMYV
jgi:hypothetical protein